MNSFDDLESVRKHHLYWAERPLFPLMSKDTRAGSRRTEPDYGRCVASLDISGGTFDSIKNMLNNSRKTSPASDAPALPGMPAEQDSWMKVT